MERFTVQFKQDSFRPPVYNWLKNVSEGSYFYNRFWLRHPLGIYNLTTTKLASSISNLQDHIKSGGDILQIDGLIRLIIYDFFKFYDSCWEILLGFCDTSILPKQGEFLYSFIKKHSKNTHDVFFDKMKADDDFRLLKNLYNSLKHTSNDIRIAILKSDVGSVVGYWLQTADGNSGVTFDEGTYPISSTFEIHRLYYLIYKISDSLKDAIESHCRINLNQPLLPIVCEDDPPLKEVAFEYESHMTTPTIEEAFAPLKPFERLYETVKTMDPIFLKNEDSTFYWKSTFDKKKKALVFDKVEITIKSGTDFYKSHGYGVTGLESGEGITRTFGTPIF